LRPKEETAWASVSRLKTLASHDGFLTGEKCPQSIPQENRSQDKRERRAEKVERFHGEIWKSSRVQGRMLRLRDSPVAEYQSSDC